MRAVEGWSGRRPAWCPRGSDERGQQLGDRAGASAGARRVVAGEVEQGGDHSDIARADAEICSEVRTGRRILDTPEERQVGGALDRGQRGAQLVGQLGGQSLLGQDRRRDPVEQVVEGLAQRGELVGRRPQVEAVGQVVLAPLRGPLAPSV